MPASIQNGSLAFVATVDYSQLEDAIGRIEGKLSNLTSTANKQTQQIESMANKAAQAIGAFLSITAATNFIKKMAEVRGEFQQLEVAFRVMLGSKEKADKLMSEVVRLAAETPFSLQDAAKGAKQLVAYGFSADTVADTLTKLGNIAAGVSAPLNDIVYLYGTLRTQGRAYAQDIKQFTGRGIPIIKALSDQFGVSEDKVNTLVAAGKVGFADIETAFNKMTGSGGMFFNLMKEQSKTITGQISNLSDALDVMFNELGQGNEGVISATITGLTSLIQNYKTVIDLLEILITAYGAYRAALVVSNIYLTYQVAAAAAGSVGLGALSAAATLYAGAAGIASKATAFLNATILANPFVTAATALAALTAYLIVFRDRVTEVQSSQDLLKNSTVDATNEINKQQSVVDGYLNVLRSATSTEQQRIVALKELQKINPKLVEGIDAASVSQVRLTDNVNEYIMALRRQAKQLSAQGAIKSSQDIEAKLQEDIDRTTKVIETLKKNRDTEAGFFSNQAETDKDIKLFEKQRDAQVKIWRDQKKETEKLAGTFVQSEVEKKKANKELIAQAESLDDLDAIQADLKEQYKKANTEVSRAALAADLTAADARRKQLDPYGNLKQSAKDAKKEISELQKVMDKVREFEEKASGVTGGTEERNKQNIQNELNKLLREAAQAKASPEVKVRIRAAGGILLDDAEKKLIQRQIQNFAELKLSITNEGLANVRNNPDEELRLRKRQIDQQLQIDIAANRAAQTDTVDSQIKTLQKENELKAVARKQNYELDVEFEKRKLDVQLNNIKRQTDILNIQDTRVVNDPTSTTNQKYEAQERILQRNKKALKEMIELLRKFASSGFANVDEVNDQIKDLELNMVGVNDQITDLDNKHIKDIFDKLPGILNNSSMALNAFSDAMKGTNDGLADTLETLNDLITGFGGIAQLAGAIGGNIKGGKLDTKAAGSAAGNIGGLIGAGAAIGAVFGGVGAIVGAAVGAVVGGVIAIVKGGKKVRESLEKTYQAIYSFQVNQELGEFKLNQLLRERLLLKSKEQELTLKLLAAQKEALLLNQKGNQADQDRIMALLQQESFISGVGTKKRGGFLGLWRKTDAINQYSSLLGMTFDQIQKLYQSNQLDGKAKELFEQLLRLQQEGQDIAQQLKDLKDQADQVFTGTTSDSITDSIIEGFKNGNKSAADFASNFEDLMRNAALNALKFGFLEGAIKDFYQQFSAASQSGGVLTKEEIADLQAKYNAILKDASDKFNQLQEITGINLSAGSNDNTLTGAIKGMTETQVELLAGQFGGLRLTAIQQLSVLNNSLSVLNAIKRDTAFLVSIDGRLRVMNDLGIKLLN